MSRIPDLGQAKFKFENLPVVLEEYGNEVEEAYQRIKLKGLKLDHANRENPGWFSYYDQRRIELYTITKWLEANVQRVKSKLFRNLYKTQPYDLSDRAKDKFVESEPAYLSAYEIYLEGKEMYETYVGIVEAFKQRGYALRNITSTRVQGLEDAVI